MDYTMKHSSPEEFYDQFGEGELHRLGEDSPLYHRLEFERTLEQLEKHLPPNGRVLDAGGASGRYSKWLAEQGYDVELVDISKVQLELAEEHMIGEYDSVSTAKQSISDLQFDTDSFDAVLCVGGPLSHVVDKEERGKAIRELNRVAKPGSPVFVSVIGLLNTLLKMTQNLPENDETPLLESLASDGLYTEELVKQSDLEAEDDDVGFTECKFFRLDEFRTELESNGLLVSDCVGLEQFTYGLPDLSESQEQNVKAGVNALPDDDSVVDMSPHMLAVCTATKE